MDITINAEVHCLDGEAGHVICVIIHPVHKEVTDIVVREKGLLGMERLVPVDQIIESSPEKILLRCTRAELSKMENFIEMHYIGGIDDFQNYGADYHYYHPYLTSEWEEDLQREPLFAEMERIPPGEIGFHRGARVEAKDGEIGKVDEFLLSESDYHITHIMLREGHLWGQKRVAIPVSSISRIEDERVYLDLDKGEVEKLPAIPVRRHVG